MAAVVLIAMAEDLPVSGTVGIGPNLSALAEITEAVQGGAGLPEVLGRQRCVTGSVRRVVPIFIAFCTSPRVAIVVSPGVVIARAPWAAPHSTDH